MFAVIAVGSLKVMNESFVLTVDYFIDRLIHAHIYSGVILFLY